MKQSFSLPRWLLLLIVLLSLGAVSTQAAEKPAATIDPDTLPVPSAAMPIPTLPPRPFAWRHMENLELPPSIQVYEGDAVNKDGQPVKAWYAAIDYSDRSLIARTALPQNESGREITSAQARRLNAYVAVNGGYFSMGKPPAATYSLAIDGGKVIASPIENVVRKEGSLPTVRAALGVRPDRTFDFAWVMVRDGEPLAFDAPVENPKTSTAPTRSWKAIVAAMGGGPMSLRGGKMRTEIDPNDWERIGLNNGMIAGRHPRTALGVTGTGRLILFVVDGRQPLHSMGMTIAEEGEAMRLLGCTDAVNLDGGGSTTFVVNGKVLNTPSDGNERRVTSIFAIAPDSDLRVLTPGRYPLQ